MVRRRIIWLTVLALMVLAAWHDRLSFGGFLLLWFVAAVLVKIFDPEAPRPDETTVEPKTPPEEENAETSVEPDEEPLITDDVIRIHRRSVVVLRNSLMRHHNSRGTDRDYQSSATARETTEILQVLNAALARKPARLSAHTRH